LRESANKRAGTVGEIGFGDGDFYTSCMKLNLHILMAMTFLALAGCGTGEVNDSENTGDATCAEPAELLPPDAFSVYYLIVIDEAVDLEAEVARLSGKYPDLNAGTIIEMSCHCFSAHPPSEVIEALRCEESVTEIHYDIPPQTH